MKRFREIVELLVKSDASDFSVDREILSNLTKLKSLGLKTNHAIDVGAHIGTWTRNLLTVFPDAKVILIEPQKSLFDKSILDHSNKKLNWVSAGAGPVEEFRNFKVHGRSDSSSFALHKDIEFEKEISIQVRRVDNVVKEIWGDGIYPEIVKLDCEGWDLEVLSGLGELLPHVEFIFLEAGLTNKYFNNSVGKVISDLDSKGFQLFDIASAALNPSTGFTWNAELYFVNSRFSKYEPIFRWAENLTRD